MPSSQTIYYFVKYPIQRVTENQLITMGNDELVLLRATLWRMIQAWSTGKD